MVALVSRFQLLLKHLQSYICVVHTTKYCNNLISMITNKSQASNLLLTTSVPFFSHLLFLTYRSALFFIPYVFTFLDLNKTLPTWLNFIHHSCLQMMLNLLILLMLYLLILLMLYQTSSAHELFMNRLSLTCQTLYHTASLRNGLGTDVG